MSPLKVKIFSLLRAKSEKFYIYVVLLFKTKALACGKSSLYNNVQKGILTKNLFKTITPRDVTFK